MTEKRFRKGKSILTDFPTGAIIDEKTGERYYDGIKPSYISSNELVKILNNLNDENEQLKQQRKELLRLIDNNIEIYENINTNVEFHQGEIQGKLTVLNNLREVILND